MRPLQRHKGIAEASVDQQVDTSSAVLRSDLVLAREPGGDAQQARRREVDARDAPVTKPLADELAEFRPVVIQPREIVQPLIDYVLILSPLVFDDHGSTSVIDSQGVDTPAVALARRVLRIEELHASQGVQVLFEESLQLAFGPEGTPFGKLAEVAGDLVKEPGRCHLICSHQLPE